MASPMKRRYPFLWAALTLIFMAAPGNGQTSTPATVPTMVKFSGTLQGMPSRIVGITFALYKEQQGGPALWLETQSVLLDASGHYSVQLGATLPNGLPKELFTSGEARWLGVQTEGRGEQPRVLLLSVPYALKAADAETVGGLPASAFVLATPTTSSTQTATNASTMSTPPVAPPPGTVSGTGTANFIPLWTDNADIGNSVVYQSGTGSTAKIGVNTTTPAATLDVKGTGTIRGVFTLPSAGVATAIKGQNSQPMAMTASAFSSGTKAAVNQNFRWQAEAAGNNTASPSGTLNLLFGSGVSAPAETGLKISSGGVLTFATGQTFPGAGTISGVSAGSGLTGGGTNGNVTLNLDTTQIPQLNVANTFTGNQTVGGNLSATGAVTGSAFQIGSNLFGFGSYIKANAFLGFAGNTQTTGSSNTAVGALALLENGTGFQNTAVGASTLLVNSTGSNNTASGISALQANTAGSNNTASGADALNNNTTGNSNSALGFLAGPDSSHPNLNNSTAIGANATVTASNSLVLGSISGVNGASASTNVGIGTTAPAATLDVNGTGNFTGPVTFVASQTFPNTISGVTAGTGLTGGGTGGAVTLNLDTTKVPLLSAANTFVGNQGVTGNLAATGNLTVTGPINGSSEVLTNGGSVILRVNQLSLAANTYGIISQTDGPSGIAVYGQSNDSNGVGMEGLNNSATGGFGVYGVVNSTSGVGIGVWGKTGSSTGSSIGVEGDASSPTGIGVVGTNPTTGGLAGEFFGAVQVNGNFAGTGSVTGTTVTGTVVTGATVNATSAFSLGGTLFASGSQSLGDAFLGFAGNPSATGSYNTGSGSFALTREAGGNANTATGYAALYSNLNGGYNTAIGYAALLDTGGSSNTAVGGLALTTNLTGSNNTAIGYLAGTDNATTGLTNATAIGAFADVGASNALVLGSINGVNSATADTHVGIGTPAPASTLDVEATAAAAVGPVFLLKNKAAIATGTTGNSVDLRFALDGGSSVSNPNAYLRAQEDGNSQYGAFMTFATMADGGAGAGALERMRITGNGLVGIGTNAPTHIFQVGQGLGNPYADGWSTYSSRRWKTNIRTLPDALAKVEQLRGVSYNLKGSGKHEIGVIAEEVGQVVPEVVSYEENGKDAQGVDYSRLTAVLIEAVKEQQRQIQDQRRQIRLQQRQIASLNRKVGVLETAAATKVSPGESAASTADRSQAMATEHKFLAVK